MIHKHRCLESEIDAQGHWKNHRQPLTTLPFKNAYSSSFYFDQCNIVEWKDWDADDLDDSISM